MPTIMRIDGMRVMIHSNDHRPAHVHVFTPDGVEAEFWLNCPDGPPTLRIDRGMPAARLRMIASVLATTVQKACENWETIHGPH